MFFSELPFAGRSNCLQPAAYDNGHRVKPLQYSQTEYFRVGENNLLLAGLYYDRLRRNPKLPALQLGLKSDTNRKVGI